jgi:hypothetical protein
MIYVLQYKRLFLFINSMCIGIYCSDMTADQKGVVKTYSVAVILMFTLVLFWFIFFKIGKMVKHFIYGSTDVVGDASAIHLR